MSQQNQQEYLEFLVEVLQITQETSGNPKVVYPLLIDNADKLDDTFAYLLHHWIINALSSLNLEQGYELATTAIGNFCALIQDFPLVSKANNIEIALAGYQVLASFFNPTCFAEDWARTQNHLGSAYRKRIYEDRAENLENSIRAYELALQVRTYTNFPEEWASTNQNLANVYAQRIRGNRAENLEIAIKICEDILSVRTQEQLPEKWANTKNTLGALYEKRIYGNRASNIETAISVYQEALSVYTYENFPIEWAIVQINIGGAYLSRIYGDRSYNLETAISVFQLALRVYPQDEFPECWASIQGNLSIAYCQRILGGRSQNLEKAIEASEAALQVFTPDAFPFDWAATKTNLGNAHRERLQGQEADNLETAIIHFKEALEVRTYEAFPEGWAETQNNLGAAYYDQTFIKENSKISQQILEDAISCYKAALQVRTCEAFPKDWAMTQHNLGNAYGKLEQFKEAITSYSEALKIYTPSNFPIECLGTGRELGNLALSVNLWREAIKGYSVAIDAVETSRSWAVSDTRRQEILAETIDVYTNMVQACINAEQLEKAIETVERSRSKRLVDLMASNDLYADGEIPPEVEEYLQQYSQLQEQIDQERLRTQRDNTGESNRLDRASFGIYTDTIQSLEKQKRQIWQNIRKHDPVLAGEIQVDPPNLAAIQKLLDSSTTAILSFFTTSTDTHVFVVQQNQVTLHTCTGQGLDFLQNWIAQNWLTPYIQNKQLWMTKANAFLAELSQRLQIQQLIEQHLQNINELIIVPHLLLHQIPFAALSINDEEYLGDQFLIRYTPSCQILEFCHQRQEIAEDLHYGIVEDATGDLPCASYEGEQIATLYTVPDHLRLQGKQQATRANYQELAKQVQVLHSCHHAQYNLNDPLNSVLVLADGNITLGPLMTPAWRLPNLSDVFLSCCETGLGLPDITDDLLTLAAGFLCTGVRSVVSTFWSVDDLATALFSLFYYQYRQAGKTRPEALQHAQIKLRSRTKDDLKNDLAGLFAGLLEEVKAKRDNANREMKKYPRGSVEESKLKQEYDRYDRLAKWINYVTKDSPETYPFEHPQYWSAFICQGLR